MSPVLPGLTNDPFGREAKKKFPYDDVLPTSVVSVHRVRFVIDRANIPEDSPGDREDCLLSTTSWSW